MRCGAIPFWMATNPPGRCASRRFPRAPRPRVREEARGCRARRGRCRAGNRRRKWRRPSARLPVATRARRGRPTAPPQRRRAGCATVPGGRVRDEHATVDVDGQVVARVRRAPRARRGASTRPSRRRRRRPRHGSCRPPRTPPPARLRTSRRRASAAARRCRSRGPHRGRPPRRASTEDRAIGSDAHDSALVCAADEERAGGAVAGDPLRRPVSPAKRAITSPPSPLRVVLTVLIGQHRADLGVAPHAVEVGIACRVDPCAHRDQTPKRERRVVGPPAPRVCAGEVVVRARAVRGRARRPFARGQSSPCRLAHGPPSPSRTRVGIVRRRDGAGALHRPSCVSLDMGEEAEHATSVTTRAGRGTRTAASYLRTSGRGSLRSPEYM